MAEKIVKDTENKCPKCGTRDVDWYDSEVCNDFIIYPALCNKCGTEFEEMHKITYEHTEIVVKD